MYHCTSKSKGGKYFLEHLNDLSDFNNFISEKIILLEKRKGITHERVASYLGVSESFIKQVSSSQYNSHYNVFHLWKLAKLFNISVDELLPPVNDYSAFQKVRPLASKEDYIAFQNKYQSREVL